MIGPVHLLKFENEMRVLLPRCFIEIFRETEEQNVAQKIEDRFLERRDCAVWPRRSARSITCAIFLAHRLVRARDKFDKPGNRRSFRAPRGPAHRG